MIGGGVGGGVALIAIISDTLPVMIGGGVGGGVALIAIISDTLPVMIGGGVGGGVALIAIVVIAVLCILKKVKSELYLVLIVSAF